MYSFNIILTEICNANCSHCYMANSKKNKTMAKESIKTIIDKMPKNTQRVIFTGGEVFLKEEILLYSIDLIKQKFKNIVIGIESNGIIFYKNIINAKAKFKYLKNMGVSFIRFSDDPFHEMGGVDLKKVRGLEKIGKEAKLEIKYLVQSKALPIGKAESLEEKYKDIKNCMNKNESVENPYLFLDVDGNVFVCPWKCMPPIGNMFNDSWEEIENNLKLDFNKLILVGKIEEAINLLEENESLKKNNIDYSKKNGQCMLCIKKFSK